MWKLVYSKRARRDLDRLPANIAERILDRLERLERDPFDSARGLVNSDAGNFRVRVGDYRVTFDLEGEEIRICRIGHRRDIYDR